MLSVLPAALEVSPWGSAHRKRPLPPGCLGEYQSAASRGKRLRQELLRLREWEQRVLQENLGAQEGQGDSVDETFTIEPKGNAQGPSSRGFGSVYPVEDALDSTSFPVNGLPPRVSLESANPAFVTPPCFDQGLVAPALSLKGQATSDLTNRPVSSSSLPVHTPGSCSLPFKLGLPSSSGFPSSVLCSGTLAAVQEDGTADGQEEDSWSNESCDLSGSANPLLGFVPANGSDGASVQQRKPESLSGEGPAEDEDFVDVEADEQVEAKGAEENLPREETSQGCGGRGSSELCSAGQPGSGSDSTCRAAGSGAIALLPLPLQFLGMAMPQRLRLLEFFLQASELLGLGVQSVYLAAVMLDCCWVEEGVRQENRPCPVEPRESLQKTGLACLLHAFLSTKGSLNITRSTESFCRALHSGASRFPRVEAMLPANAPVLERHLARLRSLLPIAVAKDVLSTSPRVYGSMLELRGRCSQKEHLLVFVSQLRTVGCPVTPRPVLAAANCCFLTGAVPSGHADSGVLSRAGEGGQQHHREHFEVLQSYLCSCDEHGAAVECGCSGSQSRCLPESSVEVSV